MADNEVEAAAEGAESAEATAVETILFVVREDVRMGARGPDILTVVVVVVVVVTRVARG